jgi:membrane protease YdiL (CAAX protease family)
MAAQSQPVLAPTKRDLIAPVWHTVVLLAVFAAITALGWSAQRRAQAHSHNAVPARLVPLQMQAIVFEWATLAWVWFGVRRKGVRVRELVGGQWLNAKSIAIDVLLAAGLWILWIAISKAETLLLGHAADSIPHPANFLEGFLAVAVAISAGICEEIVFRGYLQRQFLALTGSAAVAVLVQAIVFGVPHVYQGLRLAMMASLYGILFGVLALWRRSLRPGIMAHAWSDVAARLLRI